MNYTISDGKCTLTVSSRGAELISAKFGDFELIWQDKDLLWPKHSPVLFPICGRLKNQRYTLSGKEYEMPVHGFVTASEFSLAEKSDTKLTLKLRENEETKSFFPFDFDFVAEYELSGGKIYFRVTITNKSEKTMPYMFGWHPAFNFPDSVNLLEELTFDFHGRGALLSHPIAKITEISGYSEDFPLENGKYIQNSKELYEIDTAVFSETGNAVSLYNEDESFRLNMAWTDNVPYLCIWKKALDEAKFVCIEPWSSIPRDGEKTENFDERNMRRLTAGESERFVYEVELQNY